MKYFVQDNISDVGTLYSIVFILPHVYPWFRSVKVVWNVNKLYPTEVFTIIVPYLGRSNNKC
jgi:hypothetical protein